MSAKFSEKKKKAVWDKTNGKCWYCGIQLTIMNYNRYSSIAPTTFCIEHAHPKKQGGKNNIENLLPACRLCNAKKHNRTVEEYRNRLSWINVGVTEFSEDQIDWLQCHGISLPIPKTVIFWGENNE